MMIPEAVKQLHLCSAFKGYATNVMDCISCSHNTVVYVRDNDETRISELTEETESENVFIGYNPKQTNICLLSIDHQLIDNHPGGIADCAVFNKDIFCFVEFKTNAEGRSLASVEKTYLSAISQIENTLRLFVDKMNSAHADLYSVVGDVVCHIAVASKFPRNLAMEQNYIVSFATKWRIELSFENYHSFS